MGLCNLKQLLRCRVNRLDGVKIEHREIIQKVLLNSKYPMKKASTKAVLVGLERKRLVQEQRKNQAKQKDVVLD